VLRHFSIDDAAEVATRETDKMAVAADLADSTATEHA
jgi:hypothetical protein